MRRITLIGTVHRETGKCNEHELANILLSVGPEVIFEELRPADFDWLYGDDSRHTVEMQAIKKYLEGRQVRQVPVDVYEIPESFGPRVHALDEFVESRSGAYREVMDEMNQMKSELGFNYLNSQDFIAHIKKSEQLYKDAVHTYGNDSAKRMLSEWNDQIRKRDSSMLENIYSFCRRTDFMEAVFLVGAGHMSSIEDGIESRMKEQPTLVAWKFWNRP